ncbi:MAG: protein-export chaperone SecB [Gammaproteobacteria bacterium]
MNEVSAEKPSAPQLHVQKIYIKDSSFEAPQTPQIFTKEWKPAVDIQLANKSVRLSDEVYEVVLTVTVTVQSQGQMAYLVEVQQSGLFQIVGVPEGRCKAIVSAVCPNILFPFARETVANLVSRGGFPQLLLAPINFEALYAEQLQRQRGDEGKSTSTH